MRNIRQTVLPKRLTLFVVAAALLGFCDSSSAQQSGAIEFGANYNYVHANLPPGGCGCFSLQGGSAWGAFSLTRNFAVVGELAIQHASGATAGQDLTLTSYTVGPRFAWPGSERFRPFAQALIGGAHAGGSLAPGASAGFPGSPNSFAFLAGGGLDLSLNRHFSLRAFEADYYLTHFANGVNDHQNNLRISVGLIFRL
jgi:outer membrane immunogenic protein